MRALDRVSLSIESGEAFGIIGPNGAGKTTFLGCLLGFLKPDSGRVTIEGREADDLEIRAATGYLPERLVLDRWMSGADFLRYHHALARLPEGQRERDVMEAIERVGLEPESARRSIRKYSRGMLQRLGMAQALLGEPRYVFLDEPASGVDPAGVVLFRRLLGELKARGATVVLNSHQLEQVERVCDRVAFVQHGHVESIETVEAGARVAHVLRVRWSAEGQAIAGERLAAIAAESGAELRSATGSEARFAVSADEVAARLLRGLIGAGLAVVEAVPEESRLERLFLGRPAGSPPPPSPEAP